MRLRRERELYCCNSISQIEEILSTSLRLFDTGLRHLGARWLRCVQPMVHKLRSELYCYPRFEAGKRLCKLARQKQASDWFKTSGQTSFISRSRELKDFV